MDHQYPTVAKIPILDTGEFEQWQFRIQQYLQLEHYALWEVIEFGDSYKVPTNTDPENTTTRKDDEQSGRTINITTEDMQRKKNDVKARTTLLLSLPDDHQLGFSKYKIAKELWVVILKTFGEFEKDDLNQKFLTSLAPEWLMHTIVLRNRNDLDTMSLDDLYNHLKVYEAEVQMKSNSNSQNMAFISSSKNSSGNEDGNIACSNGSQIKFEDINQIDKDDMEEIDIKWNMALLSMRADKFWKRTGKKISIQVLDVAGFDKSKVECFNCHKMGHFARECRAPRREDHALVADVEASTEFGLMTSTESKVKEGIGYNVVPPPAADLYLSLKKDLSWTGLPEFVDDTVTDYSRPLPTVVSTSAEGQNKDSSTSEDVASPNTPKPFVKFVKPEDSQTKRKGYKGRQLGLKRNFPLLAEILPLVAQKFTLLIWEGREKLAVPRTTLMTKVIGTVAALGNISYLSDFEPFDGGYVSFECIVLGRNFKLLDDANILLRTPRKHNMYSIDLNNIVPYKDLTCLVAKASADECILWHRRLGHLNVKTHTCTACLKGKQHKATCKSKAKDDTSDILKKFITEIENLKDLKVKIIRVLVNKSQNKIPYELFNGRTLTIGFLKPFSCHIMILNTLDNLGKFEPKGDEVDAGTNSTNLSGTKDAANQEVKNDVSSLRYIALPNWAYDALLESSSSKPHDESSTKVPKGSGNPNSTASSSNPPADQMESLTVESPIPTDPAFPVKVYKVEKAMYGLHQALRAWQREDLILVQVYVDDIIFGSSNPQLCREFEALMHEKFQMSATGKDGTGKDVDLHLYRSMIGSLMYLTASRLDIMFAILAFSDSDYGGASQDRKSTTGFLGR
nr:hypothetical protein [Tanacetum cinerariifolium]